MMKCKWAGDPNDEYCKSCDGIKMIVDDNEISCSECAGYEPGEEAVKETKENKEPNKEEKEANNTQMEQTETVEKQAKNKNSTNTTHKSKKHEENENNNATNEIKKVSEEKKIVESVDGVKVVSLRYTSSATVKKGDNYFKFTAEEEWDVSNVDNVEDTRDILWAKLNAEVDKQIEELQNL